jgi:succinate dehydrogenase / fumarate reductase membrane anchor subunit
MSLRSPLARALGHGSAKDGIHHWWVQRLTSLALLPLSVWLLVSLVALPDFGYGTVTTWLSHGWTSLWLVLGIAVGARHSHLGVQVVIEDYVHSAGFKTFALIASTFGHVLLAAATVFAVLKVAFAAAT